MWVMEEKDGWEKGVNVINYGIEISPIYDKQIRVYMYCVIYFIVSRWYFVEGYYMVF